jgi:hypothetical protein
LETLQENKATNALKMPFPYVFPVFLAVILTHIYSSSSGAFKWVKLAITAIITLIIKGITPILHQHSFNANSALGPLEEKLRERSVSGEICFLWRYEELLRRGIG